MTEEELIKELLHLIQQKTKIAETILDLEVYAFSKWSISDIKDYKSRIGDIAIRLFEHRDEIEELYKEFHEAHEEE